jgi:hypothetical protein
VTTNFDYDAFGESLLDAPKEGGIDFNTTLFGRVTGSDFVAVSWDGGYQTRPYEFDTPLAKNEHLQFTLNLEGEKKDGETFSWSWRYIKVKRSGKNKADWAEFIMPSIVKEFSKETSQGKAVGKFFSMIKDNGFYAQVEDFKTGKTRTGKDGNEYPITAPVLLAVYKNKAECDKAKTAKITKSEFPPTPSKAVISQFEAFIKSVGGLDAAREVLAEQGNEYEGYSVDTLVEVAGLS